MSMISGDIGGLFTADNVASSDYVPLYVNDQWQGQVCVGQGLCSPVP